MPATSDDKKTRSQLLKELRRYGGKKYLPSGLQPRDASDRQLLLAVNRAKIISELKALGGEKYLPAGVSPAEAKMDDLRATLARAEDILWVDMYDAKEFLPHGVTPETATRAQLSRAVLLGMRKDVVQLKAEKDLPPGVTLKSASRSQLRAATVKTLGRRLKRVAAISAVATAGLGGLALLTREKSKSKQ